MLHPEGPRSSSLFLPSHPDYTASPLRLEKEKKLTVQKRQTSLDIDALTGISKQYSLPFLARVESGYCQVAEEEEVSICRKAEAHHLLALWFGIDSLSMAHPFFEPCQ